MPCGEAHAVLDQLEATLKSVERSANSILNAVQRTKNGIAIEKEMPGMTDESSSNSTYSRSVLLAESLISNVRNNVLTLYKAAQTPPLFDSLSLESGQTIADFVQKNDNQNDVDVHLEEDAIYVKLPMLWTRDRRQVRSKNGRYLSPENSKIFRSEIINKMVNAPEFSTYDVSKFSKKIIHFLYVFDAIPSNRHLIVDNDNHDTKYIQDAIVMNLPGGDNPLDCFIYSSAALSQTVQPGTYVTVTPMEAGAKTSEEIIHYWLDKCANS